MLGKFYFFCFTILLFSISPTINTLCAQNTWVEWEDESTTWLADVSDNGHEKDIAVSDLNNDGLTDVVIVHKAPFSNAGPKEDLLLLNNGSELLDQTAAYAPEFISNPSDARDVFIGDFDDDGWDDVIIANTFEDQPIFYHNLGEDSFGNWLGLADESNARFPLPVNVAPLQFCALWAGDIDGDDDLDIYFSNYGQNSGQGGVQDVLFINDGDGSFTDETDVRLGNLQNSAFGTSVEIHDMDGDDDLDIVKISTLYNVPPWNSRGVFLLFNDGTGNFSNWQNLTPGAAPYMFTIGDFDDNNLNDLYVVDDNPDYILTAISAIPDVSVNYAFQNSPDPRTVFFGGNCKLGDLDKDGDLDFGIAGVDVDIPPCQINGIRQFTMDRNDGGMITAPYGPVNYPWNVSAYDFAFINLNDDCFPDLFLGRCNSFQVFINQSEIEPIEITGDTLICNTETTTLSAPSGYVNYLWSTGDNNQDITVGNEGSYCVTVTNEFGCTTEDCTTVIEQSELSVGISGNPIFCFGETTTLIADPGFSNYLWSTNETSQSISASDEGTYCVTVSDDSGCSGNTCFSITENPELSVSISGQSSVCFGDTAVLSASDGFETYLWDNGETDASIMALPGQYCITATDSIGCMASTCFSVLEFPEVVVNISGDSLLCVGESDTLIADAGFSSYIWSIDDNDTTQNIVVNEEGTYCVTVTDSFGCLGDTCFTILENPLVSINIMGDTIFCAGESETLEATDGFSSYLWSTNEITPTIIIDEQGTYCVTVSDDKGCLGDTCILIAENPEIILTIVGELTLCTGESTKLIATEGYASYFWTTGDTSSFLIVDTTGLYCVTVTDDNGCTAGDCANVFFNIPTSSTFSAFICHGDSLEIESEIFTETGDYEIVLLDANIFGCDSTILLDLMVDPEIIILSDSVTNDDGNANGSIQIVPGGGTPPFIAIWSNGGSGGIISNLTYGDYSVTITDSHGCTETFTYTVGLETSTHNQIENVLNLNISPNPFSTKTQITFKLPIYSEVQIDVINIHGNKIENLFTGFRFAGDQIFEWKAKSQPAGVYFFKIQINREVFIKKVMLLK